MGGNSKSFLGGRTGQDTSTPALMKLIYRDIQSFLDLGSGFHSCKINCSPVSGTVFGLGETDTHRFGNVPFWNFEIIGELTCNPAMCYKRGACNMFEESRKCVALPAVGRGRGGGTSMDNDGGSDI